MKISKKIKAVSLLSFGTIAAISTMSAAICLNTNKEVKTNNLNKEEIKDKEYIDILWYSVAGVTGALLITFIVYLVIAHKDKKITRELIEAKQNDKETKNNSNNTNKK